MAVLRVKNQWQERIHFRQQTFFHLKRPNFFWPVCQRCTVTMRCCTATPPIFHSKRPNVFFLSFIATCFQSHFWAALRFPSLKLLFWRGDRLQLFSFSFFFSSNYMRDSTHASICCTCLQWCAGFSIHLICIGIVQSNRIVVIRGVVPRCTHTHTQCTHIYIYICANIYIKKCMGGG